MGVERKGRAADAWLAETVRWAWKFKLAIQLESEVETRRGEIVTMIRQDEDSPATVANESLFALLYGEGHPYGRRARGTLASVGAIDRRALRAFHAGAGGEAFQ